MELLSVWFDQENLNNYREGSVASGVSVEDVEENKTINLLVPYDNLRTVYEHMDFHEFDVVRTVL